MVEKKSKEQVANNDSTYTSYTTDGHKVTQTNSAGSYLGDPDTQYATYQSMLSAAYTDQQYSSGREIGVTPTNNP